jgi:RNA polymerase sigma-70 factor (family 1)
MHSLTNHSDEQLILLLGQDNEQAFNEIYDRFWNSLFTKAYNFLRNEEAAKDCVQEVFIWLWQHRHTVKIENVNNYLHQAVRFQTFKVLKEQKQLISLDERLTEFTSMILKDESLQYKELKEIMFTILSRLPADQQEIFLLNREQGLTYKEIAEQKNISIKTVEKKMSLALKMLKQQRPGLDEVILLFLLSDTIS